MTNRKERKWLKGHARLALGASAAIALTVMSWGGGPPSGSDKDQMHIDMINLAATLHELRPFIETDPNAAAQFALLQAEYDQLCADMGGDDPAFEKNESLGEQGPPGGGQVGGISTPPNCIATTTVYTNTAPLPIPDNPGATVSSSIVVSGADPYLFDLNMTTFITHTFAADLDITLRSPAGTIVTITTDNGGGFDNVYNGTVWDDSADPDGQVPYTTNDGVVSDSLYANLVLESPLVPEENFAAFIGEDPNGTWTLTLDDDLGADVGVLNSWSLEITALETAPLSISASISTNAPLAIPTGPAVVSSSLAVGGLGSYVCDIDLSTNLTHTFAADLDITLRSPAGTVVTITTDNGGGFDNVFNGTAWNDDADPDGQVPYVNNDGVVTDSLYANLVVETPLTPEEAFGAFIGEDPNGTWTITISDDLGGDGGTLASWSLSITTCTCEEPNEPPVCPIGVTLTLWPPNHHYNTIDLNVVGGVIDPDGDPITYSIDTITQDEPVNTNGDGDTTCDGVGIGLDTALIRAERRGGGNGRVYNINYTASDGNGGSCNGTVTITVPHSQSGDPAIDDGQIYDSTQCFDAADLDASGVVNVVDLVKVITDWGLTGPDQYLNMPDADTNLDGIVDVYDLVTIITNWTM